jgi:hypothetical protein
MGADKVRQGTPWTLAALKYVSQAVASVLIASASTTVGAMEARP